MPDELWTGFVTLYRRQGSRPSPWGKKMQKEKLLSEEALQIPVKRREAKSKGEKKKSKEISEGRVPKNSKER